MREAPLADRMRPRTLNEFVGQDHLLGQGKVLRQAIESDQLPSMILWGPPGSGKTTLAARLVEVLRVQGVACEFLDGDEIRKKFPTLGFSREERNAHVRRVGALAQEKESQGISSVVSLISPYRESREAVRQEVRNFVEIYVSTPLQECEKRDPKGLHAGARRGEVADMTGSKTHARSL